MIEKIKAIGYSREQVVQLTTKEMIVNLRQTQNGSV